MNKLARYLYGQKNARRLKLFERIYTKKIYAILQAEMKAAADMLRDKGVEHLRHHIDTVVMIQHIGPVIQDIYKVVGVYYANRTTREIRGQVKEVKGFGFDTKWIKAIIDFFRVYLLTKAVLPITETTKKVILDTLNEGIEKGFGIDKMAFQIENSTMTVARARLIARTEILKAQWKGQEIGKDESIWETVDTWISAHDSRVRHSHRDVDGESVNEGQRFKVAIYKKGAVIGYDMMTGPGDPEASAGNVINCRCTRATRLARDVNGRLIRKQSNVLKLEEATAT